MNNTPIYLNTASCGLLLHESVTAATALYNKLLSNSSQAAEELRDNGLPRIRQAVADFLTAPVNNIAFVPNFSYAFNAIVQSLRGDEKVMLYRNDYPSVYEPFRINGFDITWIETGDGFNIDVEAMKTELLAKKIEVLAISHVQWMSGYKLDIIEIGDFCAQHNIVFIVDATQSIGAIPIFVSELKIDAIIASNYKWMNAGFGTGVMYMSDALLQRYPPVIGGNGSYAMVDNEWKYEPSVRSYEPGHPNLHGLLVLEAAVNNKLQQGIVNIEAHSAELTSQLIATVIEAGLDLLGPTDISNRSPIVLVKAGEDLHKHLLNHNIITTYRNGYIRISVHYYNRAADIAALATSLQKYQPAT